MISETNTDYLHPSPAPIASQSIFNCESKFTFYEMSNQGNPSPLKRLAQLADVLAELVTAVGEQLERFNETPDSDINTLESIAQIIHQYREQSTEALEQFDQYLHSHQWSSTQQEDVNTIKRFVASFGLRIRSDDNLTAAYIRHLKGDDSEPPIPLFITENDDGTVRYRAEVTNDTDAEHVRNLFRKVHAL